MAIHNFSWVMPGKLAGSALPGGLLGVPDTYILSDLRELREQQVACLVSLQRVSERFAHLCAQADLEWIHYPIVDFGVPEDVGRFNEFIDDLIGRMESGRPLCVHCRAGIGRTGMVLACVVGAFLKIDGRQAIRAVRKARPALDTPEQIDFVNVFCAKRKHSVAREHVEK